MKQNNAHLFLRPLGILTYRNGAKSQYIWGSTLVNRCTMQGTIISVSFIVIILHPLRYARNARRFLMPVLWCTYMALETARCAFKLCLQNVCHVERCKKVENISLYINKQIMLNKINISLNPKKTPK